MAKDRAKNPKRVPSLGIGEPISHVNVTKNWQHIKPGTKTRKYDSNWQTDDERAVLSKSKETNIDRGNAMLRLADKTPVVKIDSAK